MQYILLYDCTESITTHFTETHIKIYINKHVDGDLIEKCAIALQLAPQCRIQDFYIACSFFVSDENYF